MSLNKNPGLLAALQKLQTAQQSGMQKMQEAQVAQKEESLLNMLIQALESIGRVSGLIGPKGDKGEQGDDGYTPIKGIDYRDGIDGKDGLDGENGKDGLSIKGDKGDPGNDAIANPQEIIAIASKQMKKHEKEFDHKLIHDPKMLGEYELDVPTLQDGDLLQIKGKKIVGTQMPKVQPPAPYFTRGGAATNGRYQIKTITASYALDPLDNILHVDASVGNITVTFYTAAGNEGSHVFIKRIDSTLTNTVTFVTSNGETIDFETLFMLVNQGSGAEVYTDSKNFFIKHN